MHHPLHQHGVEVAALPIGSGFVRWRQPQSQNSRPGTVVRLLENLRIFDQKARDHEPETQERLSLEAPCNRKLLENGLQ